MSLFLVLAAVAHAGVAMSLDVPGGHVDWVADPKTSVELPGYRVHVIDVAPAADEYTVTAEIWTVTTDNGKTSEKLFSKPTFGAPYGQTARFDVDADATRIDLRARWDGAPPRP